jgi:tRNA threonylcarbamoyladenosine biosynthesis protein TsaB
MLVLGIETSSSLGSVALWNSDTEKLLARITAEISAAHSEKLVPYIEFVLSESKSQLSNIGLIAVSIGPGSFTGLRVGLMTAKGIALAKDIPVVGVDTLMACAYPYLTPGKEVCAIIDAKREEVYFGIYNIKENIELAQEASVITLSELYNIINDNQIDVICGDIDLLDPNKCSGKIGFVKRGFSLPDALSVAILGFAKCSQSGADNLSDLTPEYMRNFVPGKPRL